MTVKEILYRKYNDALKNMNRVQWKNLKEDSERRGVHPAQIMYMGLEITANDIRANGGWIGELWMEIKDMRDRKLLASNENRQYGGHLTAYWLTKKGWRMLNKDHEIC